MKEKKSESGFTLAELLIVVAIIGVLVAISIPIFTSQLERSREATDAANIRAQYAQVMTEAIATGQNVNGKTLYGAIPLKQQNSGWNDENMGNNLQSIFGKIVEDLPKEELPGWSMMQQERCPFFILTAELLRTEIPVE